MSPVSRGTRRAITTVAGVLLTLLTLLPTASFGLGLGTIKVNSALNEPLDAEIDFISATDKELRNLEIGLAPIRAFKAIGIELNPRLSAIQFKIERRLDGKPYIRLTTRIPYTEPFLHILLQAEWTVGSSVGRLRREYTALIDPPFLSASKPGDIQAPRPREPAPVTPEPEEDLDLDVPIPATKLEEPEIIEEPSSPPIVAGTEPRPAEDAEEDLFLEPEPETESDEAEPELPEPSVEQVETQGLKEPLPGFESPSTESKIDRDSESIEIDEDDDELMGPGELLPSGVPDWASADVYHVKRGDMAYNIARHIRRDDTISLEQIVLALYDANPRAFFDNNTNNLRAGKILKIPDREAVLKRGRRSARREFFAQYDVWQEYKLKLASSRIPVSMENPLVTASKAKPKAEPKLETKKSEVKPKRAAPKKKIDKKTVAKKPDAKTADSRKGMQLPPSRSSRKEELLRIVRADLDSKAKTAGKSAQTESAKGKQILKEDAVTLQKSDKKKGMTTEADKVGKPEATKGKGRLIELDNADLASKTKSTSPPKPEVKPVVKPIAKKKPLKVAKSKPRPKIPTSPPKSQIDEIMEIVKGVFSSLMSNQYMLMVAGGVGVIGVLVGFVYLRRRRKTLREFEESILTTGDVSTGELSTGSEDVSADSGDTSFLSDFSQGGMGNVATDEVDPIAEADVYLAYGRDEQAEEILKDAIVKHPERNELKEKLLEVYAQRNDSPAFETLAEELYASLEGKGGELWDRVAEMGLKLNPDNPMFSGGAPSAIGDTAPAMPALDETQGLQIEIPSPSVEETQAINLADMQAEASAPEIDIGGGIELDMGVTPGEPEVVSDEELGGLEFNLDIGGDAAEPEASAEAEPSGADSSGIEFEPSGLSLDAAPAAEDSGDEISVEGDDSGLSEDEENAFVSLRENKAENDKSDLGISIDTSEGDLELSAADLDTSLDAGDISFDADDDIGGSVDAGEEALDVAVASEVEEVGGPDQWDESATKLDLAKAYIDMGDEEGARSILEEVAVEGNEEQKKQATDLASQIS